MVVLRNKTYSIFGKPLAMRMADKEDTSLQYRLTGKKTNNKQDED